MRYLVPIILVIPALAQAQPQTKPSTCDVTIVRAPDDVRPVVQHWIDAEPHCRGSLEVRIIPTEGGYYLIARDERGHTNERVVPDATSAGVLIASWAADDRAAPAPVAAPEPTPIAAPPIAAPPVALTPLAAPMVAPTSAAPGATPMFEAPANVDGGVRRSTATPRWISMGALGGPKLIGARLDMDLARGRSWAVGVAGSMTDTIGDSLPSSELRTYDGKAIAYASAVIDRGAFELRFSFGFGLAYTKVEALYTNPFSYYTGAGLYGIADAAIRLGYRVSSNWGLAAGPVLTIYDQAIDRTTESGVSVPMRYQRPADLSVFFAVQRRL